MTGKIGRLQRNVKDQIANRQQAAIEADRKYNAIRSNLK